MGRYTDRFRKPRSEARRRNGPLPSTIAGGAWGSVGLSVVLALLWAFHAAAFGYPGHAYFHVAGLNDTPKPVSANVLLQPAFICAVLFMAFRSKSTRTPLGVGSKCGIGVAMACWMLGATLSTFVNSNVDLVVLTYCSVFLAGAAVYAALAGTTLKVRDLEIGLLGLAVGALFPLIGGLQAFAQEWGVPDVDTTLSAYQNLLRMEMYEMATFGNRGNTAAFIVIIAPLLHWIVLDKSRTRFARIVCGAVLLPAVLNLMVLEVRAAFLTVFFSFAVIWGFKLGIRRYPLFAVGAGLALILLFQYLPDVALLMSDRLRPVITADTEEDTSLMERAESIKEGLTTAERNWELGIGPGGALTRHSQTAAHQFQVQQFMETGILGLVGSALFSGGVLLMLVRTLIRGQDGGVNNIRFALIIGPASFVVYSLMANATFNVGYVNTWGVLVASMLALTPGFKRQPRPVRAALLAAPRSSGFTLRPALAGPHHHHAR